MSSAPAFPSSSAGHASRPLGIAMVVGAASLWGTTGTAQALAGGELASTWFGALRLLVAAGFFAVVAALAVRSSPRGTTSAAPSMADSIGAGLCMAVYNLAFFAGVRDIGVGLGTAIALGSGPIWAGVLQATLQRQRPTRAWWFGTVVAVTGGSLMALAGGRPVQASGATGIVLCLLSGLSYAIYTLLNKRMAAHASASSITVRAFVVAALIALPAAWLDSGTVPGLSTRDMTAEFYTGIVTAGVPYLLYSRALKHIAPATGVTLALTEPVVAFCLAVTVLGEPVTAAAVLGLLLVVAGVLLVVRQELAAGHAAPSGEPPASATRHAGV